MADTFKTHEISRLRCSENGDRLSNLPESILHHIFSFLETIDIVRASAVSRKWRYFWVSVNFLNFNINNIRSGRSQWLKLVAFINWVFMYHNGSIDIQRFGIVGCHKNETLYRWISVLVKRKVQVLDLVEIDAPFKLPHCLVTCESLLALKLHFTENCPLQLPANGFSRLKSLDLHMVKLEDDDFFRNFISSCPLLENLIMKWCVFHGFNILDISATRLKNLTIDTLFHDLGLENCEVKIACPSLQSFVFSCERIRDFSFRNLNSLQNVFLMLDDINDRRYDDVLRKIIDGLCSTRVLTLTITSSAFFRDALDKSERFAPSFHNLKSLILDVDMEDCHMLPIVNLLNCSPNLGALIIRFDQNDTESPCTLPECCEILDKVISCVAYHLKRVELLNVSGCKKELELVRYLLKHGHALQQMSIFWCSSYENHDEIVSKVMKFPRSSSNVTLTFRNHCTMDYFKF